MAYGNMLGLTFDIPMLVVRDYPFGNKWIVHSVTNYSPKLALSSARVAMANADVSRDIECLFATMLEAACFHDCSSGTTDEELEEESAVSPKV
mmetsp:Transcript_50/g.82  ORF Transcript_50/g.82 Transcript_50/m.82 type:complete len:93 (-) Transcript_50:273-551(-)